MHKLKDQIVASTLKDRQGERLTLDDLREICPAPGTRLPLRSHHDLGELSNGYLEDYRVIPHPDIPNEWVMVADGVVNDPDRHEDGWGFSWSFTSGLKANCKTPEVAIYLPWPLYADSALVDDLLATPVPLKVGKWVKKAAEPISTILLTTLVTLAAKEVWDLAFKKVVYPYLAKALPKLRDLLPKGHSVQIALSLSYQDGHRTNVILMPSGDTGTALSEVTMDRALCEASRFIRDHDNSDTRRAVIIVLVFDSQRSQYVLLSCEYDNGQLVQILPDSKAV